MPLTRYQQELLALLATRPREDRYLAGGAAMHFAPDSQRFSDDLDFFHDSEARVAEAFAADRALLQGAGHQVDVELSLPGLVRALVRRGDHVTRVDWGHDSAWRFLPLVHDPLGGLLLHPVDLAINKLLALAGRDEPRDFVDILFAHARVLPIPGLCWAAPGKDPGLTPLSLLDLLRRRGRYREADFARLQLATPFDLVAARGVWEGALAASEAFVRGRPVEEYGCLYYDTVAARFVVPRPDHSLTEQHIVPHFGAPGGVIPRVGDGFGG